MNVIDGFTLEPIKNYKLTDFNKSLRIDTKSTSFFVVESPREGSVITVNSVGFTPQTISLNTSGKELMNVILEPNDSLLNSYHNQYDIYSENNTSKSDTLGKTEPVEREDKIYTFVDTPASYVGGEIKLKEFLSTNVEYPQEALDYNISGKVYIRFVVTETGKVENVHVVRGKNLPMDRESVRTVKSMPAWIPAKNGDTNVSSYFMLPIYFIIR